MHASLTPARTPTVWCGSGYCLGQITVLSLRVCVLCVCVFMCVHDCRVSCVCVYTLSH